MDVATGGVGQGEAGGEEREDLFGLGREEEVE